MFEILKLTVTGLLILLPLANPLTTVALFLGLSGNMTEKERNKQARMAAIYIFAIMITAWYAGQVILTTFGISIPGLRIAGGLIVSFIGFNMLFPKDEVSKPADNNETVITSKNIAFVPIAMPGTAGPGTIALIISTASTVDQINDLSKWAFWITPILVFLIASFVIWICLKSANTISRFFGKSGIDAISSIMGFLLICMGVQFIINGILEIVASFA